MEGTIHTLQEFMLHTESITYHFNCGSACWASLFFGCF